MECVLYAQYHCASTVTWECIDLRTSSIILHKKNYQVSSVLTYQLVPGTKNMNNDQRLAYLNDLPKLEERRVRGDMIETYKILTGKEDTKWNRFFKFAPERGDQDLARGLKLFHKRHKLDKRKYVFSHRVTRKWNELSREEVQSVKTSGFKEKYDKNEKERKRLISENDFTSGVRNYILRVFRSILSPRGQVT